MAEVREMTAYFKFLCADGATTYGHAVWPLPTEDGPADWMPRIKGALMPCFNGYHILSPLQLAAWCSGEILVEVEAEDVLVCSDKCVARRARAVRRVEKWNPNTWIEFACWCAEQVLPAWREWSDDDSVLVEAIAAARSGDRDRAEAAARAATRAVRSMESCPSFAARGYTSAARSAESVARAAWWSAEIAENVESSAWWRAAWWSAAWWSAEIAKSVALAVGSAALAESAARSTTRSVARSAQSAKLCEMLGIAA